MISANALILKLRKERMRYRHELQTQFVEGIVKGLHEAIQLTQDVWQETKATRRRGHWYDRTKRV